MSILNDETVNFTASPLCEDEQEFEYMEESIEFVDQYGSQYVVNFGQQFFD